MDCLPVFPGVLPKPLMSGYGYTPQSTFIRTQMDSGRARQRRRFKTTAQQVSISWILNNEQLASFEAFFDYELCHGAGWFRLNLGNGIGISCVRARFVDPETPYQIKKIDNSVLWQLSATLETFEMPKYDEYTSALLRDNTIVDIKLLAHCLKEIIHTAHESPYFW